MQISGLATDNKMRRILHSMRRKSVSVKDGQRARGSLTSMTSMVSMVSSLEILQTRPRTALPTDSTKHHHNCLDRWSKDGPLRTFHRLVSTHGPTMRQWFWQMHSKGLPM